LPRTTYRMGENGRTLLRESDQVMIRNAIDRMAGKALRTIAIGVKSLVKNDSLQAAFLERDLTFIGLYGLIDAPRKEVKQAIEKCRNEGIKTVMITGDNVGTARSIASPLNMLPPDGMVLEGYQLNQMSVDELVDVIDDVYVFVRVTPEHKLKIVKAFQEKGNIVAISGDGVNDAHEIRESAIGIS